MNQRFFTCGAMALAFVSLAGFAQRAAAEQSLAKMTVKSASLGSARNGVAVLRMSGMAEAFGNCVATSEVQFAPSEFQGVFNGLGVVSVVAGDGSVFVGVVAAEFDTVEGVLSVEFHWRDSVMFSDGRIVAGTGRLADRQPAGIIAILIGL